MVRARKPKGDPPQMFGDEDPRAPYKVYEGDELVVREEFESD